ncbi:MAG: ribonuclease III [Ilumatobacteraceae bacterium]|jgi:ribonuclease-3|nr:ribonuclease III [Ilumatobacteraceae bacterium]
MTTSLEKLAEKIGYKFADKSLLETAMRHSSWTAENIGFESNERLEFLGDSVIGFVVADIMYRRYPDFDEGKLTDLRKIVVNMNALSRVATQLGLGEFILLGRGEEAGGGREKTSILANALEAVFAAVYLDSDAMSAYALVRSLLSESIDEALAALKQLDAKSQLQELCSRLDNPMPEYRVTDEGPDHAKTFYAAVYIGNDWMGAGSGRSKKVAEELAAQQAFATLQDS